MEFFRRKPQEDVKSEETWQRMERLIREEGRFLPLIEIMTLGDFTPAQSVRFVDHSYRFRGLLKQFSLGDKSLIVGADEVPIPEIGSPRLDVLMVGAGFTREEFVHIRAAYGLPRDDSFDGSESRPHHPSVHSGP